MIIVLFRWLWGWASLIDGLVAIFTLGFARPDLSVRVSKKILNMYIYGKFNPHIVNPDTVHIRSNEMSEYLDQTKLMLVIYKEVAEAGYNLAVYNIDNNKDLIDFALSFLLSNLEDAFSDTIGVATDIDPELGW